MRQSYQTSTGQNVHAIYAYHQLTVMHGSREVTYRVPQALRSEALCTVRRKRWERLAALLDALDDYFEPEPQAMAA